MGNAVSSSELPDGSLTPSERALALQIELTAVLARGKGVGRLLRGWHQRTGEPVAVFDRLGNPLGRSDGFSAEQLDESREALRTRPPRLGESLRLSPGDDGDGAIVVTPFAGNDTVRGFLARRSDGAPTAALAAPALRALLALEYERHWLMDEPARRRRDRQFTRLLELDPDADIGALLEGFDVRTTVFRGLAIEARNETHAEVLFDDLAAMLATPFVRHRDRIVECLTPVDPLQALADYGLHAPIGLGTPLPPRHAARSIRQARHALDTSRRVGAPMEYRDGASHDFLLRVASPEYLESFAAAALGAIEHSRGGDALLDTLHVWLIERRSIEATAERTQVHRHTVRNRIQRIAQLTGHDLDSIDTQTELWLALKARGFERAI